MYLPAGVSAFSRIESEDLLAAFAWRLQTQHHAGLTACLHNNLLPIVKRASVSLIA